MYIQKIKKRDGRILRFNQAKIEEAITKAFLATEKSHDDVESITNYVIEDLSKNFNGRIPTVEDVQDAVEAALINFNHVEVAKAYILYRDQRSHVRNKNTRLMQTFHDITFAKSTDSDLKRENANINSDTPMGSMLKYGSEGAKEFFKGFVLNPRHLREHESGLIHIHDLDFLTLTLTCCQIDLTKLFKNGFTTGHGSIREPKDIKTYAALACIAIQSNQNDQHGGQSVFKFDYDMANGVIKTYFRNYKNNLTKALELTGNGINVDQVFKNILDKTGIKPRLLNDSINKPLINELSELTTLSNDELLNIIKFTTKHAHDETVRDTHQAMESLIHNLNTMHSRAGAQVPFSSINYGTDTSNEGRLVVEQLLLATQRGLGIGETPIFPIQIFKVKEGVNFNPGDPNYDLFKLAIETSAKRLFPNFSFIDAKFNKAYYKPNQPETEVAYMGCRTRVMANAYDDEQEIVAGRGNLSFTSINLPRIAIQTQDLDKFYEKLNDTLELVVEQLLERFEIQKKRHVYNFPFLMGEGVWIGSDKLSKHDTIEEVIKHGTLTAGFIGLAEALKSLTGYHHAESKASQKLGLEIIKYMRDFMDKKAEEYKLNFSLIATPAEGLSGRFVKIDREQFGVIEGVTDREYYTNSFHVPVYYPITAFDKISIEAPYHELTNGGHISYVELDGDPLKNLEAFESIIRHMHKTGIGYGSVNHPVDYDPVCKYVGVIDDQCPKCGRFETKEQPFDRIRRITGYLVGTLDRFNDAKRAEVSERMKHFGS